MNLNVMHDNACPHTAAACRKHLEAKVVHCIELRPIQLEMYHIDNLWDLLDRKIQQEKSKPSTFLKLHTALEEEWINIP